MVKTVDRGCIGFEPYKGDLDKVEPFEARESIVANNSFGFAYCKTRNWKQ